VNLWEIQFGKEMVAFQRNFVFQDEPSLSKEKINSLNTIVVKRIEYVKMQRCFKLESAWVELTNRQIRYYSHIPFGEQNIPLSWAFEVKDVVTLVWDASSQTISYIPYQFYTPKLLQFWIFHTFFPLVLRLAKEAYILHVSGVKIGEKSILFSAFSGGGKSTLVDYFLKKKHPIYGDDTVALIPQKKRYKLLASYPFIRPFREPEVLGDKVEHFVSMPQQLSTFYHLKRVSPLEKVEIVECFGIEKFTILYQSMFVTFESMKQEDYLLSTQIAEDIKVFQISIPWDKNRLEDVYQAILTHNNV
jgi:hypothetical protein